MISGKKGKFSLLMANYNNGRFIKESIDSVLAQIYKNWELVIVDDCSDDDSLSIIKPFLDNKKIKLIQHEKHLGCGAAKRTAANNAAGEFLGELDPDDLLRKDAIEAIMKVYRKNPEIGFVYSTHYNFKDNLKNSQIASWVSAPKEEKTHLHGPKASAFRTYRRADYNKTEGFCPSFLAAVDRDMIYKMEEFAEFYFVSEPLYYRRLHKKGISQAGQAKTADYYDTLARHDAYLRRIKNGYKNLSRQQAGKRLLRSLRQSLKKGDLVWSRKFILRFFNKDTFLVSEFLFFCILSLKFILKKFFYFVVFTASFFKDYKNIRQKSFRFLYVNLQKYYHFYLLRILINFLFNCIYFFTRQDIKVKKRIKFLVVACPRSGTFYISNLLKANSVNCGHEDIFSEYIFDYFFYGRAKPKYEADSSFLAAPCLSEMDNYSIKVIHIVRNPLKVITSLMDLNFFSDSRTNDKHHQLFLRIIKNNLPKINIYNQEIDKCVYFYLQWNKMIEKNKKVLMSKTFRIEDLKDGSDELKKFLGLRDFHFPSNENLELFNNKAHEKSQNRKYNIEDIHDEDLKNELKKQAEFYGYNI